MKRFLSIILVLAVLCVAAFAIAADDKAPTEAPAVAPAPAPAPAPAAAAPEAAPELKPDPSGANTGGAADVVGASAGAPTADDLKNLGPKEPLAAKLADTIGHNRIAINIVWTLVAGFLVMFMQAGFAMVETGFVQAKNAGHTMAMNFMVYALGMLGYWLCGFALQMGGVGAGPLSGGTALLTNEFTISLFGKGFRSLRHNRIFPFRCILRRIYFRSFPVSDGLHGYYRYHPDRLHGRKMELQILCCLWYFCRSNIVSALCQLGMGRRLVVTNGQEFWIGARTC